MQIMQYDHAWPGEFEKLRNQLAVSLQPWLQGPIQHVGSTAVPGLAAKPIIDMAAPVRSIVQAHHAIPVLELAGWMSWPSDPNRSWRLCSCARDQRLEHITSTSSSTTTHICGS